MSTEWQPIETAPKDGANILVFIPEPKVLSNIIVAYWYGISGWWTYDNRWMNDHDEDSDFDIEPTHWQPLPDAPSPLDIPTALRRA